MGASGSRSGDTPKDATSLFLGEASAARNDMSAGDGANASAAGGLSAYQAFNLSIDGPFRRANAETFRDFRLTLHVAPENGAAAPDLPKTTAWADGAVWRGFFSGADGRDGGRRWQVRARAPGPGLWRWRLLLEQGVDIAMAGGDLATGPRRTVLAREGTLSIPADGLTSPDDPGRAARDALRRAPDGRAIDLDAAADLDLSAVLERATADGATLAVAEPGGASGPWRNGAPFQPDGAALDRTAARIAAAAAAGLTPALSFAHALDPGHPALAALGVDDRAKAGAQLAAEMAARTGTTLELIWLGAPDAVSAALAQVDAADRPSFGSVVALAEAAAATSLRETRARPTERLGDPHALTLHRARSSRVGRGRGLSRFGRATDIPRRLDARPEGALADETEGATTDGAVLRPGTSTEMKGPPDGDDGASEDAQAASPAPSEPLARPPLLGDGAPAESAVAPPPMFGGVAAPPGQGVAGHDVASHGLPGRDSEGARLEARVPLEPRDASEERAATDAESSVPGYQARGTDADEGALGLSAEARSASAPHPKTAPGASRRASGWRAEGVAALDLRLYRLNPKDLAAPATPEPKGAPIDRRLLETGGLACRVVGTEARSAQALRARLLDGSEAVLAERTEALDGLAIFLEPLLPDASDAAPVALEFTAIGADPETPLQIWRAPVVSEGAAPRPYAAGQKPALAPRRAKAKSATPPEPPTDAPAASAGAGDERPRAAIERVELVDPDTDRLVGVWRPGAHLSNLPDPVTVLVALRLPDADRAARARLLLTRADGRARVAEAAPLREADGVVCVFYQVDLGGAPTAVSVELFDHEDDAVPLATAALGGSAGGG